MPGTETSESSQEIGAPFIWRVRLSDKAPSKVIGIVAAGVAAFLIGEIVFKNFTLGLIGFAIIFGSTAEYWLGSVFQLDEKKASVRTGASYSVIEWTDVKRICKDEGGIKLSPLESAGTMDAFRGVYLRFGDDNREAIEKAVLTFGKLSNIDVVR